MWRIVLITALAGCSEAEEQVATPLPAQEPWASADGVGPYAVGTVTHEFTDARGVDLTVEIWYPARPEAQDEPSDYGDLSLVRAAYRDAPVDRRDEPFPLVAFSHGYGGIRYQSTFLTEHLASHGFVVVAPDHPNNTLFDLDDDLTGAVALARPGDVSSAVDEVTALSEDGEWLAGMVQPEPFGMVGHSFGGWTSLAVGGGEIDLSATAEHCEQAPTASCRFLDLSTLTDTGDAAPDPRVGTVVALAPGGAHTFADGTLHTLPNALVIGGRRDGDMPYDSEIRPAFEALGPGGTLATLARSGHWAFTDLCELIDVFDDCQGEGEGYMDADAVQAITNTLVTAHLRASLLGSVDDANWVSDAAWTHDADVTIEVSP